MKIDFCPLCGSEEMNAVTSKQTLKVKGVDVTADYTVFMCNSCKEKFTNDVLDEINVSTFKEQHKLQNMKHETSPVKCDLCSYQWVAVRPFGLTKLECPNCTNLVHFENL